LPRRRSLSGGRAADPDAVTRPRGGEPTGGAARQWTTQRLAQRPGREGPCDAMRSAHASRFPAPSTTTHASIPVTHGPRRRSHGGPRGSAGLERPRVRARGAPRAACLLSPPPFPSPDDPAPRPPRVSSPSEPEPPPAPLTGGSRSRDGFARAHGSVAHAADANVRVASPRRARIKKRQ